LYFLLTRRRPRRPRGAAKYLIYPVPELHMDELDKTHQPDPDIIDLPRRAIGTPQVLAGFIFLLALVMMEGVVFAWFAVERAKSEKEYYDRNYANIEFKHEYRIKISKANLASTERTLKENRQDLSEEEINEYEQEIGGRRRAISITKDIYKDNLKWREQYYREDRPRFTWNIRFAYFSMACFVIGAFGLIFGAISLAFSIGTGRRWTWGNVILLPVMVCLGLAFLYYALDAHSEYSLPFTILGIASIPLAIVLRRVVEWVAPVRDESHKGRDRLRKSDLSLACVAIVIIFGLMQIAAWRVLFEQLENSIPYSISVYASPIVYISQIVILIELGLFFLFRRKRLFVFASIVSLAVFDVIMLTWLVIEKILPYWNISKGQWEILLAIPPLLLFFYPLVALAVMLVRPLGKKLFERSAA